MLSHLDLNIMKIPGILIGDKATEVQLRLLWVVNHFIMEGSATLQLENNENKDAIVLFVRVIPAPRQNALRFKLLIWRKNNS